MAGGPGTNHPEPGSRVRTPFRCALHANRHDDVAHEAHRVSVDVCAGTRHARCAVGWRLWIEREHLRILEEVLVTLQIDLEPKSIAEIADRSTGASFTLFDVASDVHAQVRRNQPLRVRGRG